LEYVCLDLAYSFVVPVAYTLLDDVQNRMDFIEKEETTIR